MKKELTRHDDQTATIGLTIEHADYAEALKKEINSYKNKVQLKGFRKGKTPLSLIKKMYGQSILADIINKQLEEGIADIIQENKIDYLGQPMPADDEEAQHFDVNANKDYSFQLQLGLAPEVSIDHLLNESYTYFNVDVEDHVIDDALLNMRKSKGERITVEQNIEENDMLTLVVRELTKTKKNVKSKGLESSFSVLTSQLSQEYKDLLLNQDLGIKIQVDIYELEPDRDDDFIRKNFLKLEEEEIDKEFNPFFEAEVVEISRIQPAEMNEDFFQEVFGSEVSTENEAKAEILEQHQRHFEAQSDGLFMRTFQQYAMQNTTLTYPEEFLKKWLVSSNEDLTEEVVEKEFDLYIEDLTWSLLRSALVKEFDLKVENEEIINEMRQKLARQLASMGMPGGQFVEQFLPTMLENKEQVQKTAEEVLYTKMIQALKEKVTLTEETLTVNELEEKIKEINEKDKQKQEA